jgi:hypothetical protein
MPSAQLAHPHHSIVSDVLHVTSASGVLIMPLVVRLVVHVAVYLVSVPSLRASGVLIMPLVVRLVVYVAVCLVSVPSLRTSGVLIMPLVVRLIVHIAVRVVSVPSLRGSAGPRSGHSLQKVHK